MAGKWNRRGDEQVQLTKDERRMTEKTNVIQRPRIVTIVSVILTFYLVFPLALSIIGIVLLILAFQDSTNRQMGIGIGSVLLLAGLSSFYLGVYTTWNFYSLNRIGYIMIKISFNYRLFPDLILWLVTNRGKRLNDKDVRDAFGLRDDEF
jgi:hypothetical protein